ncbi:MAG: hypothetical protein IJA69_01560, partial [Clostridia bacterium]|nr:hypothetical protein [Clostridia bacterium]
MLEYEFDNLDDQFVTIWSKYFLYQDESLIIKDLETLAEMGQINAVQSWYLFRTKGDNKVIDQIVESYTGANYNELFAMANYEASQADEKQELQNLIEQRKHYEEKYYSTYDESYVKTIHEIDDEIVKLPFIKKYQESSTAIINISKNLGDPIVRTRACEITLTLTHNAVPYQNNKQMSYLKSANKSCVNSLMKIYKQELKKKPDFKASDNPQLCYSLAKAIAFPTNKKHKELGNSLFKQLADRPLCLTSYQSTPNLTSS